MTHSTDYVDNPASLYLFPVREPATVETNKKIAVENTALVDCVDGLKLKSTVFAAKLLTQPERQWKG